MSEPRLEAIAAEVHAAWMQAKQAQGVISRKSESGEELMVPYASLSEGAKELDRATVRAVKEAESRAGGQPPSDGMPSESTLWVITSWAMLCAYCGMPNELRYDPSNQSHVCKPYNIAAWREALAKFQRAAERGVSAVPPTEEPNDA